MPRVSQSTIPTVPPEAAAPALRGAIALPRSAGTWWLVAAAFVSLLAYYVAGIDQGALSVFGSDMHIHELMHDGRHVLAFPCH
ncbi:MAG TPA: CbtB-domain containing protein [Thermoleophilaceae bacterium]|nr:CbtB-domain containing protein [Thermoleophilaceae bacterium]